MGDVKREETPWVEPRESSHYRKCREAHAYIWKPLGCLSSSSYFILGASLVNPSRHATFSTFMSLNVSSQLTRGVPASFLEEDVTMYA